MLKRLNEFFRKRVAKVLLAFLDQLHFVRFDAVLNSYDEDLSQLSLGPYPVICGFVGAANREHVAVVFTSRYVLTTRRLPVVRRFEGRQMVIVIIGTIQGILQ